MESKTCTKCGETKPVSDFNLRSGTKYYKSWCKRCNSLRNILRDYGVSIESYAEMLETQDHRCALCGTHEDDVHSRGHVHRKLNVDHDHVTGKVRGLLCHNCNVLLGHANDNVAVLQSAIAYLQR